nr:thermonuclease family protein [Paludisphaera soli]
MEAARYLSPLFLLLLAAPACSADYPARVVGVSDGDTLTVLTEEKRQVKIRLHGIDAPESGQDFGQRAKQAASELAFGKAATIRPVDTDRYGRTVAEVILPDGRSLNRELTREGYCWWYRAYAPGDRELARLESEAKAAKRGLWSRPNPTPPWDWRKGVGVPATAGVVGNRGSRVYHAPHCGGAGRMSEKNRVEFTSAKEAEEAGYRKAEDCRRAAPIEAEPPHIGAGSAADRPADDVADPEQEARHHDRGRHVPLPELLGEVDLRLDDVEELVAERAK